MKDNFVHFLALFGSFGTLICCALPALLVSLGAGATLVSLVSYVPGLIWVSENKEWVFLGSGVLLIGSGLLQWSQRNAPCPLDPRLRDACLRGRTWSRWTLAVSAVIYVIGAIFAFGILGPS